VSTIEVKVPDIGDFTDIPVIEIFVKPGDTVKAEDSLVTLESDKATMDVPSPVTGTVRELKVKLGDKVAWLLELQQAGAFTIRNLPANDLANVLSIAAPNYLLSFARATVADLVTKGGFPPFLLPLVTFEGLHARAAQAQQPSPAVN